jgi:hypothetical protein
VQQSEKIRENVKKFCNSIHCLDLSLTSIVSRVCRVRGLLCPGFVVSRLSVQGLSVQRLSVQGLSVQGLSVYHKISFTLNTHIYIYLNWLERKCFTCTYGVRKTYFATKWKWLKDTKIVKSLRTNDQVIIRQQQELTVKRWRYFSCL